MTGAEPAPRIYVEAWPGGGWVVRLAGHRVPVSRHDTEEEALDRAAAYRRGFERECQPTVRPPDGAPETA
jgi:Uncharacterized protein conserved in bacteria (DUF2188)